MRSFRGVRGGTPSGKSLCESCRNCFRATGSGSNEVTLCVANFETALRIDFPVYDCTKYDDKGYPTQYEMEQMAFVLEVKAGRVIGFLSPEERKAKGLD